METKFIIPLQRHARTLAFFNVIALGFFCRALAQVKNNSLYSELIIYTVIYSLIVIYSAYNRFYNFPVRIDIHEDYLKIECRELFIFPRKYCWQKKDIRVFLRCTTEVIKLRNIRIKNKKEHGDGIQFDGLAVKKKDLDDIIEALTVNGYEIETKKGTMK